MDMDQSAVFLAGTILTALGFLIILGAIVIANNVIHKYWKPLGWKFMPNWAHEPPPAFASQDQLERIAPILDEGQHGKSIKERNENSQTKQK